jgi:GNAT superfamily N-acetyltransferase
MVRIEKNGYQAIYRLYLSSEIFFPLIAAVLLDRQDGVVYADDATAPSQVYVEHAFGFAQIFGKTVDRFEQALERYLLVDRDFKPAKIRLYAPYLPNFLALPKHASLRASRQRFILNVEGFGHTQSSDGGLDKQISLCGVDANNVSLIEAAFGVVGRFWRNSSDFTQGSNAVVVSYQEKPASICYAAAEADHRAEIDVLTLPDYRSMGLARIAVNAFVTRCFNLSVRPLWDCFTNNAGSMMLCKAVGFVALQGPYAFFTIEK